MRAVQFLPAALRDFDGLDRITQGRVIAALERYATAGHGDVKRLQGRVREFRLRIGKWRVFFDLDTPGVVRVIAIDNRGQAY
ncbi:MAG: type II toxin-antitoxin system RelE/ParE family toxin [Bryobacteraceae bacterium]